MAPTAATEAMQETPTGSGQKQSIQNIKTTAIGDFASIEEFTKRGLADIVVATKSVNAYPQGAARDLYCAYPTFGRIVDDQSDRILGLISKVLKWQNIRGNIQCRQQDEQFEMLMECNDAMLERLNSNLDELAGIKKNPQTIVVETRLNLSDKPGTAGQGAGSWNLKKADSSPVAARLITAKNIARPQLKFKIPIDNSMAPFVPKIKDKPNSLKPLAVLPEYDESGNITSYLHPYEFELMKWEVPAKQLKRTSPELPPKMEATELFYVDTVAKLETAIAELRQHKEIAIDVEHHSYRTFQGFTCLVQISTRSKDYIFDALELREDMHLLNEIFTNPKIVKIFHGADLDIEWLQRDLSLYVVNMFDTHQAAKILNFARLSLSYLLKHYCDIEADKTFQLADWRIRPLPPQLVAYARQDTHFLIYIFNCITNDLLDAGHEKPNLLRTIYQISSEICKKRYVKPSMTAESHMDLYRKSKRIFDNRQLFALREIFQWRDTMARQEDESYGYVLPNHMMLQIAESLPREMQGILACCNPIPPMVRQNLHTLHQIILRSRQQSLIKPILETEASQRIANTNIKDYNNKLHCPHDLSHMDEFRDDLPTLLNFHKPATSNVLGNRIETQPRMCKPVLSIFETPEPSDEDEDVKKQKELLNNIKFVSPYQRYVAVLPLIEKEKLEEAARIEAENKKRQLCPAANLLPIMHEPDAVIKSETADDLYSLPIKELLKRKYEESIAKKQSVGAGNVENTVNTEEPRVKRVKTETPTDDKLNFVNLPAPLNKNHKNHSVSITTTTATPSPNTQNECHVENAVESDSGPDEAPTTSQAYPAERQYQQGQQQRQKGLKRKMKSKNMKNKPKSQQSSDRSVQTANFDYKNVDFRKFQGGAQRAKGTELKPQFHGKSNSNKANNKKFNKLFTFSNVKGNKK